MNNTPGQKLFWLITLIAGLIFLLVASLDRWEGALFSSYHNASLVPIVLMCILLIGYQFTDYRKTTKAEKESRQEGDEKREEKDSKKTFEKPTKRAMIFAMAALVATAIPCAIFFATFSEIGFGKVR